MKKYTKDQMKEIPQHMVDDYLETAIEIFNQNNITPDYSFQSLYAVESIIDFAVQNKDSMSDKQLNYIISSLCYYYGEVLKKETGYDGNYGALDGLLMLRVKHNDTRFGLPVNIPVLLYAHDGDSLVQKAIEDISYLKKIKQTSITMADLEEIHKILEKDETK